MTILQSIFGQGALQAESGTVADLPVEQQQFAYHVLVAPARAIYDGIVKYTLREALDVQGLTGDAAARFARLYIRQSGLVYDASLGQYTPKECWQRRIR